MYRAIVFVSLALAASSVLAQNIATVNNRPIPKSREDAWVKQMQQQGQHDSSQLREMIKQELIRREVFLQEASRRGLAEKPDVKFQLDVQRQNTLIQALMRDELERRPVTDAEIKKVYEEQKAKAGSREFRARHILVEKEDEARAIVEQLRRGAKFEELAKRSKDPGSAAKGGDLDWASPEAYVKPFADALLKLEKGKFTEQPVQTQFGWHVIRLDDTREAQFPPLERVQGQIREMLQQQRVQAFAAELQSKAKIR
jgi:peptidyl-prolyl cis-trans isomerase C